MPAERLAIHDLLAPSYLTGSILPDSVDRILEGLGIDTLRTAVDGHGVVFSGRASATGAGGALPVQQLRIPSGAVWEWDDVSVDFRLTMPRDGASFIDDATQALADAGESGLKDLFGLFGEVEQTADDATEFPGVRFRLELIFSKLKFNLRPSWLPGRLTADRTVVHDNSLGSAVRIVASKMLIELVQGENLTQPPNLQFKSWGNSGFDSPSDLREGEVVRMEPPLALHKSGRVAFALDQVVLDLSSEHTPPEILAFFGTDESFQGIFAKHLRLFFTDASKDWGYNFGVRDALISFDGELSLEASFDLVRLGARLQVEILLFGGEYTPGQAQVNGLPAAPRRGIGSILHNGEVQLRIVGGAPPLKISVKYGGSQLWDKSTLRARFPSESAAKGLLEVLVEDAASGDSKQTYREEIDLTLRPAADLSSKPNGLPADRASDDRKLEKAKFRVTSTSPTTLPPGFAVTHRGSAGGVNEKLLIQGGDPETNSVTVSGAAQSLIDRTVTIEVPEGSDAKPIPIVVSYPAVPSQLKETFHLNYEFDRPGRGSRIKNSYVTDTEDPVDNRFSASSIPSVPGKQGVQALTNWVQKRVRPGTPIEIEGRASFDPNTTADYNLRLSSCRANVAREIIAEADPEHSLNVMATGHAVGKAVFDRTGVISREEDWVAVITALVGPAFTPAVTIKGTIERPAGKPAAPPTEAPQPQTPEPQPPQSIQPKFLRRLGLRMRLERSQPVLAEASGQLDFETEIERRLRSAPGAPQGESLGLKPLPAATSSPNPKDGVVDFTLTLTYDRATGTLAERLQLGAAPGDVDGLLRMKGGTVFKDIFGALLLFAPVINSSAASLDAESAGDWVALGGSLALPVTLGSTGMLHAESVTLFGAELRLREHLPRGEATDFSDMSILFDYGVQFSFDIPLLNLKSTRPAKVRYKAVGFNLHFPDGDYQPVFDTSKGYQIDLSDPGLFSLQPPLGNLLKVLAARVARLNPLTLEIDLGMKVDLGVISVDRIKLKWPLDPLGPPQILPTGVKVDIPSTLVGSGYLSLLEDGVEGALDASLVPLKLRIAASLSVEAIEDAVTRRKAAAVFAGLTVKFPSPILLLASGLGIFGFSGLFAMHYKRLEDAAAADDAVGPALRWLEKAQGQPEKLVVGGVTLWGPEFDRWSFGVGAILGSLDSGFLVNLRGMLVLELPGPRILVFVKVQIAAKRPELGDKDLTVGILGVLDLDFNLMQLTVGILVDYEIEEIIRLRLPVELFVKLGVSPLDPPNLPPPGRNWHLHLGEIRAPASALVLNLVKARGYFMINGHEIRGFPSLPEPSNLPGLAVAAGLEASIILGSTKAGLYLRVAAGAHFGVSFSPRIFLAGNIFLQGELRLFIVSIEARGQLEVQAPKPTLIWGDVCGKVSFFFFSVQGCVGLSVGSGDHPLHAPRLVTNLYLQSHAPILAAGQGGDRPIDASLGNAQNVRQGGPIPVVPIDSVPVLQLFASPLVDGAVTFTEGPLKGSPQLTDEGWVKLGGDRRVRYQLKSLSLDPPLPDDRSRPPATWRPDQGTGPQGDKRAIDLALFSRVPVTASRALERSTVLNEQVRLNWEGLCDPVAPPRCILWTFCGQPLGSSGSGWQLQGTAEPDPAGTRRNTPPDASLFVEEPARSEAWQLVALGLRDAGRTLFAARVIGFNAERVPDISPPKDCIDFQSSQPGEGANPRIVQGVQFSVGGLFGELAGQTRIVQLGKHTGLYCGSQMQIRLPEPTSRVELVMVHSSQSPQISALDASGAVVDKALLKSEPGQAQRVTLSGNAIQSIDIRVRVPQALILRFCLAQAESGAEQPSATPPLGLPPTIPPIDPRGISCLRALEMPQSIERPAQLELDAEEAEFLASRGDWRWITLHTGPCRKIVLFLAATPELWIPKGLRLRELAADGSLLREQPASQLPMTIVSGVTSGLPSSWLDPLSPWRDQVIAVAEFLAGSAFSSLKRLVVQLKPLIKAEKIQLLVPDRLPLQERVRMFRVIVGAIESCRESERQRAQSEEQARQSRISSLTGYLNGGDLVPLLEPATEYTIKATYDADAQSGSEAPSTEHLDDAFRFRTDDRPPARLDPYVLATWPQHEDRYHFYEDPVRIVFNDLTAVQLYRAYGHRLRAVLYSADGVPVAPEEISSLEELATEISTPYRDTLQALIADGLLPCAGALTLPKLGSWRLPIPLRPAMDYTLDIELDPPLDDPASDQPAVPLYRRQFSTSRFASIQALVDRLSGQRILHRALASPLTGLPTGTSPLQATDQAIQDALRASGEEALGAPDETSITVYWAPDGGGFKPHAILIDSVEPLWRSRPAPKLEVVPEQSDPAYRRLVLAAEPALEVIESAGAQVERLVHSPAGTRTLALLKGSFTSGTVELALKRPGSALFDISDSIHPLPPIPLPALAPWEDQP